MSTDIKQEARKRITQFRSLGTKTFIATFLIILVVGAATAFAATHMIQSIIGWEMKQDTCAFAEAEAQILDSKETKAISKKVVNLYDGMTDKQKTDCNAKAYKKVFAPLVDDTYRVIQKKMRMTGEDSDILNCVICFADVERNRIVYILDSDPDENTFCPPGSWDEYTPEQIVAMTEGTAPTFLEQMLGAQDKLHTIWDQRRTGTMCSGFHEMYNFDGYKVLVCVDQRITHIVELGQTSRLLLWAFLLILSLIAAFLVRVGLRRTVLDPINQISQAANAYSAEKNKKTVLNSKHFSALDIHTRDEIESLALVMKDMEDDITEHVKNITEITAERERVNTELSVATRIQAAMLPTEFPAFPDRKDFDIYAAMDPAKEVGGDFYDFFMVDENHLCMVMADVSGKGIPAALFMMAARIVLANKAIDGMPPAAVLEDANRAICNKNPGEMFVTVWIGILDLTTGKITAANAGHEKPVLIDPKGHPRLIKDKHGFVVGGLEDMTYTEYELQMEPGSRLFLYTDGVTEATAAGDKLFGLENMLVALSDHPDASPEETLEDVRAAVDEFVGEEEQFDDLTMLCVKYIGPQGADEEGPSA